MWSRTFNAFETVSAKNQYLNKYPNEQITRVSAVQTVGHLNDKCLYKIRSLYHTAYAHKIYVKFILMFVKHNFAKFNRAKE